MLDIPPTPAGIALLVAGTTIDAVAAGRVLVGLCLGTLLSIAGMVVLACAKVCAAIREVNRPADVAYVDGYEDGYDKGWIEGKASSRTPLSLLPDFARQAADSN